MLDLKYITAAVLGLTLLSGCAEKTDIPQKRDVFAMDTYMSLQAYGKTADTALDESAALIDRLEHELSVTLPDSDISRLNREKTAVVSDDTAELVSAALDFGALTGGALDVTVYPVLSAWGFTGDEYRIPEAAEISALLEHVDWSAVELDGNSVTLPPSAEIDMGALAKGYTGDRIMEIMRRNGVDSAIISLGGNVAALGSKPDGSPWKVAVRDPFDPDRNLGIVAVTDRAVVTSGNYERYFIGDDGRRYCHIIDPADGFPADNGLVSVTIIGESGIMCDALSTALFVMGSDKAADFALNTGGFDVILVTSDGTVLRTDGISFENTSGLPEKIIGGDAE